MVSFKELAQYRKDMSDRRMNLQKKNHVSLFSKIYFDHLEECIFQITNPIEKNSGWEYVNGSFSLPSDYSFDGHDITFRVNRVENGYTDVDHMNERELAFTKKYAKALSRLAKLEKKREKYFLPANTVSLEAFKNASFFRTKTSEMAYGLMLFFQSFSADCPGVGVKGLVTALNEVADAPTMEKAYQVIQSKKLPRESERTLLRWLSSFSRKGGLLYDNFVHHEVRRMMQEDLKADLEEKNAHSK